MGLIRNYKIDFNEKKKCLKYLFILINLRHTMNLKKIISISQFNFDVILGVVW
jgi:hypothetical protein